MIFRGHINLILTLLSSFGSHGCNAYYDILVFKFDIEQLVDINELLGLDTNGSISEITENSIMILISDYHYIGDYDYDYFIMFVKIYKNAYDDDNSLETRYLWNELQDHHGCLLFQL